MCFASATFASASRRAILALPHDFCRESRGALANADCRSDRDSGGSGGALFNPLPCVEAGCSSYSTSTTVSSETTSSSGEKETRGAPSNAAPVRLSRPRTRLGAGFFGTSLRVETSPGVSCVTDPVREGWPRFVSHKTRSSPSSQAAAGASTDASRDMAPRLESRARDCPSQTSIDATKKGAESSGFGRPETNGSRNLCSACTWHSLFRVPRRGFARTLCGNRSVRASPHDTPQRANLGSPPRLRPRRHARRGPTTFSSRVPHAPLRRHNVPPIFANRSNPHFRWGCFPRRSPKSHRPPPRPAPRLRPGALPMTDRHPPLGNTSRWWVQASRACPRRTWRTETDTKSPCSRPAPSAAATR